MRSADARLSPLVLVIFASKEKHLVSSACFVLNVISRPFVSKESI
jgi:hypothetical protein